MNASPEIQQLYDKTLAAGFQVLNLHKTLAHTPKLAKEFLRFGNLLLFQGNLPPDLRELAILMVGHLAKAPYEFTKHTEIGLKTGLSQAQIDAVGDFRTSELFDAKAKALLAYAEEVSRGYRCQDSTFAALTPHFPHDQIVELTLLVGYYELVCRVLEALQVEIEEEAFKPF